MKFNQEEFDSIRETLSLDLIEEIRWFLNRVSDDKISKYDAATANDLFHRIEMEVYTKTVQYLQEKKEDDAR